MTAALRFDAVTVTVADGRNARNVLHDVSFDVAAGEMVAVMGPSGSGKSTLVNLACGLVSPTEGSIELLGHAPPAPRSKMWMPWWSDRRRETVGVVHQRLNLLDGITALDNVALALDLAGLRHGQARREAGDALARVGVAEIADTLTERLSVGEQQRVAIARALTGGRPVLLADEPSAALDRTSADEITRLLADLAGEGRAVLLVTHDSQQASWADRTVVLRDGEVVDRIGEPSDAPPSLAANQGRAW
ncbi:MAG: ABC transporter ATP-binding protein [Acidimicrobiales bacterium]